MVGGTDLLTLKLKQSMTLADADDFYEQARVVLADESSDKLEIESVENEIIELPILQILTCVVAAAKARNKKVVWDNPSIALFQRSVELGLDGALGL